MTGLIGPERTAAAHRRARRRVARATSSPTRAIVGVGVAVPGLVRASDGLVRDAPHLAWTDVALRELIEAATGLPTVVGNDAAMGVLAEHLFGAARGIDDVVYLNGGASGIGGGLIVQGMPVGGASGYSGEFGQNRPGIASPADRRAGDGVLEDEVSRARLLAALGRGNVDEPTLAELLRTTRTPEVRRGDRAAAPHPGDGAGECRQRAQSGRRRPGRIPRDAGRSTTSTGFTRAVVAQTMPANGEDLADLPGRARRGSPAHRRRGGGVRRAAARPGRRRAALNAAPAGASRPQAAPSWRAARAGSAASGASPCGVSPLHEREQHAGPPRRRASASADGPSRARGSPRRPRARRRTR